MRAEAVHRNAEMLQQRIAGATLREIADDHGIKPQTAQVIVDRNGRRHLDDLELRLLANRKTNELEVLLIPGHSGPEFDQAIAYLRWVAHELGERGIELKLHHRAAMNGIAVGLEDVTPRRSR